MRTSIPNGAGNIRRSSTNTCARPWRKLQRLFEKYPHYVFNFSGANRYRFMKEYFPDDFARVKKYVTKGRWFPAGSSMEEGDVNAPSAEAIIRQILYGNDWFRDEFGKASAEYMLPDCFGFPASLPTILAALRCERILDAEADVGIFGQWRRAGVDGEHTGGHAIQRRGVGRSRWRERVAASIQAPTAAASIPISASRSPRCPRIRQWRPCKPRSRSTAGT